MKESGIKMTQVVYNSMLAACEKAGDLPRALGLLQVRGHHSHDWERPSSRISIEV